MRTRGAYFLANDEIIDLVIAFLNSLRRSNPDIALCMIPFDANIGELKQLHSKYRFTVFRQHELLKECDEVGAFFYGHSAGQYRKLAMWEGDFDEFAYIDADTIVLESIEFAFEFLSDYDFLTSFSHVPDYRKWVWKDTIYQAKKLAYDQIQFAAGTGFLLSKKGMLTLNGVRAKLPDALALSSHMELFCAEQPLLNYLITTSGKPYTSLLAIARQNGRSDIPLEYWGGVWSGDLPESQAVQDPSPRPLLIHWAGVWRQKRHENSPLWNYYHDLP
jgi:hypothetical protein